MNHAMIHPRATRVAPIPDKTPPDLDPLSDLDPMAANSIGSVLAAFIGSCAIACAGLAGFASHCGDDTAALLFAALAGGGVAFALAFR